MDVKAYEYVIQLARGIFCQDGSCSVQQLDSLFDRNSFLVGVLGLPRPNVSIQQVSTKGGKSYLQELERKKIVVVKWLTQSVFLYTTVTFHRFHSVSQFASCTNTESFFHVMTYFAFVSQYFQDQ